MFKLSNIPGGYTAGYDKAWDNAIKAAQNWGLEDVEENVVSYEWDEFTHYIFEQAYFSGTDEGSEQAWRNALEAANENNIKIENVDFLNWNGLIQTINELGMQIGSNNAWSSCWDTISNRLIRDDGFDIDVHWSNIAQGDWTMLINKLYSHAYTQGKNEHETPPSEEE